MNPTQQLLDKLAPLLPELAGTMLSESELVKDIYELMGKVREGIAKPEETIIY